MSSTANLTWVASSGAISYSVQYKTVSSLSYTVFGTIYPPTTSATITGLLSGTAYDFQITSNCATGSSTNTTITANTPCKPVTGPAVSFTGLTANLSWDWIPEAVSYTIQYAPVSTMVYVTAPGSPLTNPLSGPTVNFNIYGLTAGVTYDFKVNTVCVVGVSTDSVVSGYPTCPTTSSFTVTFT